MKKLSYLFLTLALAASVNSCDNDKNNDDPQPKPENTVLVISTEGQTAGTLVEIARVTYPLFTNEQNAKVNSFTYSYKADDGTQKEVAFAVTRSADKCEVTYPNPDNNKIIKVTYSLNAAGNPTSASMFYGTEEIEFSHYSFDYEDGMLTSIIEDSSLEPGDWRAWYQATYENSEQKTIVTLGANTPVITGTTLNNFGLDPTYYFAFVNASPVDSAAVLAAYCNLLPHTKHIPSQYNHVYMPLNVITTVENGQLKGFSVSPSMDVKFLYN